MAAVGLFLALVTQLEWAFGLILALLGLLIVQIAHHIAFPRGDGEGCHPGCLTLALTLALVLAVLLPVVNEGIGGRSAQCSSNLRGLAIAFHEYLDVHGHFPPPYVADAEGKPMHSWRVLI